MPLEYWDHSKLPFAYLKVEMKMRELLEAKQDIFSAIES
jgi:hypothetical protein